MAAITICSDFWSPKRSSLTLFPLFPHLFPMKWWDQMPWSSFSECWTLSQLFHSPLSLSSFLSYIQSSSPITSLFPYHDFLSRFSRLRLSKYIPYFPDFQTKFMLNTHAPHSAKNVLSIIPSVSTSLPFKILLIFKVQLLLEALSNRFKQVVSSPICSNTIMLRPHGLLHFITSYYIA